MKDISGLDVLNQFYIVRNQPGFDEIPRGYMKSICFHRFNYTYRTYFWDRPLMDIARFGITRREAWKRHPEWALKSYIHRQRCADCNGYDYPSLARCIKCQEIKPENFAHPLRCLHRRIDTFVCWDCIETDCKCTDCQTYDREVHLGEPLSEDNMFYIHTLHRIPPPEDFTSATIDVSDVFSELGIDL